MNFGSQPFTNSQLRAAEPSLETGYRVRYECECGARWSSVWSCACDDECPDCGADIEASDFNLDGTHTQGELDHYNSTGALPSGANQLHAAHAANQGDPQQPALNFARWLEMEAEEGENATAAAYLKLWP